MCIYPNVVDNLTLVMHCSLIVFSLLKRWLVSSTRDWKPRFSPACFDVQAVLQLSSILKAVQEQMQLLAALRNEEAALDTGMKEAARSLMASVQV